MLAEGSRREETRRKPGPLLAGLVLKGEQEFEERNEEWPDHLGELNSRRMT